MPNSAPQSYSDFADMDMMFPCMPGGIRYFMMGNMYPAGPQMLNSAMLYYGQPWSWAVCNAGSWINQNNQYVWVAGRPLHRLPVHWIKSGHTIGFVPIHPYDIAGRPPVNSRNGAFTVDPKGPRTIERMALQAGQKIDILDEPPRAFRTDFAPPLARAEAPHMAAHEIKDFSVARSGLAKASGIPITFDHRSQTFMMSHQVMQGGRSVSVTAPIGGREGGLQSRGYHGGGAASGGSAGWRGRLERRIQCRWRCAWRFSRCRLGRRRILARRGRKREFRKLKCSQFRRSEFIGRLRWRFQRRRAPLESFHMMGLCHPAPGPE